MKVFGELYDAVKAYFDEQAWDAAFDYGEKAITKQVNQGPGRANRVLFAPTGEGGDLGELVAPKYVGRQARAIFDWQIPGRVFVWAWDSSAPTDERKQWDAIQEPFERVLTAIRKHSGAGGVYKPGKPKSASRVIERPFGVEIVFPLNFIQALVEAPATRTDDAVTSDGETVLVGPTGLEEPGCD
jgi:hypothetical protein